MAATLEGGKIVGSHLIRYGIFYIALYFILRSIYLVFFHPLARYPGPLLAKVSPLWRVWATLTKRGHLIYYDMHQKYGPTFRDGPESLSFSDYRAIKVIYGREKEQFFRSNTPATIGLNPEHPPVFFSADPKVHQMSRRKVGGAYAMNSILKMERQVDLMVEQLKSRLDEQVENGSMFDLSAWINYFTIDVISDLAYGQAFGCLEQGSDVGGIISGMQGGHTFSTIISAFPALGKFLFTGPLSKYLKPPDDHGIGMAVKLAKNIVAHRYRHSNEKKDLLNAIITSKDPDGTPIHPDQVRGEVIATLVAGGDTTAMSILGCTGSLLRHPSVLDKLRNEIDDAYARGYLTRDGVPPYTELSKLPYLTAVISETLRFSPSVGAAFMRKTPNPGLEILPGQFVPAGVEVGMSNWIVGRSTDLYGEDAHEFRPERWLVDDATEGVKKMRDYEFAFGHGSRICIGRNLALVELYKTIAELVRGYDIIPRDINHLWDEELKLFLYKTNMMVKLKKRGTLW